MKQFSNNVIRQFRADLRQHHYEIIPNGIALPQHNIAWRGIGSAILDNGKIIEAPNTHMLEGVDLMLTSGVANNAFYFAPFSDNVVPLTSWTAALIGSQMTEVINYDEPARQLWVKNVPSGGAITTQTTAKIAASADGISVRGAVLVTSSGKGSASGTMLAGFNFGATLPYAEGKICEMAYDFLVGECP